MYFILYVCEVCAHVCISILFTVMTYMLTFMFLFEYIMIMQIFHKRYLIRNSNTLHEYVYNNNIFSIFVNELKKIFCMISFYRFDRFISFQYFLI